MTGASLTPDTNESPGAIEDPDTNEDPDTIECLARKLYDRETRRSLFHCVSWEALDADERDDVRHLVRSVLAVVGQMRSERPTSPGLIGLPPPLASGAHSGDAGRTGDEPQLWLRTGT
jgi:hypothetical protein